MSKFNVGDIVLAKDDYYNLTSAKRLCVCEVVDVIKVQMTG